MRLWHYKLIPYLPNSQLIAQWRELNAIFKNQPNHILINYVYEYDKEHLLKYTSIVVHEIGRRGMIKCKLDYTNMNKYFGIDVEKDGLTYDKDECIFPNHHNNRYLKQCFYNLQEKFDRGQKDFSKEQYYKLWEFAITKIGLVEYLNKEEK